MQHIAVFNLRHAPGSDEETAFLESIEYLATLEGVQDYKVCRQTGAHADYAFAISMRFENFDAFRAYMMSEDHLNFAYDKWYPHVRNSIDINLDEIM
jgi:Stress responsive A/B Barrel Domain